ncbi:MAG: divalent-cation tolerance protein CutA [Chloroflexota bacterium]
MAEFTYAVLLVTTPTFDEASLIAGVLLEQRKTACVNTIKGVSSHFWFGNKINATKESLLIVKTRVGLLDEVIRVIKEFHSYEVPEIIALPVIGGNDDYLEWIDREVEHKII